MPIKRNDLIEPELSYKILGAAFKTYNNIGWGHKEIIYQRAFAEELNKLGIRYEKEKFIRLEYNGVKLGREFLDFVVENKIVVELKVMPQMGYVHINQVVSYLKSTNLELAILIYFLKDGVRHRRIINNNLYIRA